MGRVVRVLLAMSVLAFSIFVSAGCSKSGDEADNRYGPFAEEPCEQVVVLYGDDGKEIRRWTGSIAISSSKDGMVKFYCDDVRTMIYGGTVVVVQERSEDGPDIRAGSSGA